jgi:uncharacterized DUF497 family protein
MEFEWDEAKAAANARKHGVTFEEAMSVFGDPLARIVDDPDHSYAEDRLLLIGMSPAGRLLIVSYTPEGESVRLISARRLTRPERIEYEQDSRRRRG